MSFSLYVSEPKHCNMSNREHLSQRCPSVLTVNVPRGEKTNNSPGNCYGVCVIMVDIRPFSLGQNLVRFSPQNCFLLNQLQLEKAILHFCFLSELPFIIKLLVLRLSPPSQGSPGWRSNCEIRKEPS